MKVSKNLFALNSDVFEILLIKKPLNYSFTKPENWWIS